MLTALLLAVLTAPNAAPVAAAMVKAAAPAPRVELAINETEGTTEINGRPYRCVTTDFGGRYDTVCTPVE